MKVFRLNTYMILPPEFQGTFDEALELWKERRDCELIHNPNPNISVRVAHEALFLNARYGFQTVAEAGVWELYKRSWQRKDKNPEFCYSSGDTWIK